MASRGPYDPGVSEWEPADELRGLLFNALSTLAPADGAREWGLVDDAVDAITREWAVTREIVRRKTDGQPLCRLVITLPWCPTASESRGTAPHAAHAG